MNHVTDKILLGTLGELLVQIRLLQFGVQSAPPIKDSGNDLIAVNGRDFRAISVRTTTSFRYNKPTLDRMFHVLAVVRLVGDGREVSLDESEIFLIPRDLLAEVPTSCIGLGDFRINRDIVERLFGPLPA